MEANTQKIGGIFNQDRILEIPFFQRSYVWGEDQWQRFLDDLVYISTDTKPYFFGSLIFKQQETPIAKGVGDVRTVIDGQQRLTTLTVFFKVLSLLKSNDRIFRRFKLDEHPVALRHNHNDIASFEKIADLTELVDFPDSEVQHNNIIGAYNFFKDNIEIEKIHENVIRQNIIFVLVNLGKDEDEQQIFDTLNSLGVSLTTAELLKNHFFRRDDVASYEDNWRDVFEKDDETKAYWDREFYAGHEFRTFIDLFFYAFLQIKVQYLGDEVDPKDREEFSRLENLFASYKKLMKVSGVDKEALLHEIKIYADSFRDHFDNKVVNEGLRADSSMQRINAIIFGLETRTLIPYILFVIDQANDETQRQELFCCIESFILRRLVVRANNRGYNQLFLRMISERVLTKEKFYVFAKKLSTTANAMPSDEELKTGFHKSKLVNKTARGILYFIESRIRSDKHATALLGMSNYSLEHLMPKKWQNHWSKLVAQQDIAARNHKLLTLGNLAIITQSLNASIRDSAWATKKEGRGKFGGLTHYASGIDVHKYFLGATQWDEDTIKTRADWLFEQAKNIWTTD